MYALEPVGLRNVVRHHGERSAGLHVRDIRAAQMGKDSRLSIRGSGLSRYYHLRGLPPNQDGVPLNNADGSADFQ